VASGPFQPAVAVGLGLGDEVYAALASSLQAKRDLLVDGLRGQVWRWRSPRGPTSSSPTPPRWAAPTGSSSPGALPRRAGVACVPVSVFHDDLEAGRSLVRFAFCKRDEVLLEAVERLHRL
jgi:N-succinyldiaminopimelate aminotransferase